MKKQRKQKFIILIVILFSILLLCILLTSCKYNLYYKDSATFSNFDYTLKYIDYKNQTFIKWTGTIDNKQNYYAINQITLRVFLYDENNKIINTYIATFSQYINPRELSDLNWSSFNVNGKISKVAFESWNYNTPTLFQTYKGFWIGTITGGSAILIIWIIFISVGIYNKELPIGSMYGLIAIFAIALLIFIILSAVWKNWLLLGIYLGGASIFAIPATITYSILFGIDYF